MEESGKPHIGGSNQFNEAGDQQQPMVAPTPARRALAVKITNREQIERLTPAQKQKLMRIVIAKRQLAAQQDKAENKEDKENVGGDEILSAFNPIGYTLEKRGSNHFPAPPDLRPEAKRQRGEGREKTEGRERHKSDRFRASAAKQEHSVLAHAHPGRAPPSIAALQILQDKVEGWVHEKREKFRLKNTEVNMRLVFHDGTELSKMFSTMTQLFDELPRVLVDRILKSNEVTGRAGEENAIDALCGEGSDKPAHADLVKRTRQVMSEVYSTHSRKLFADFKAAHQILVFEINGIDPSTLPVGIDVFWNTGLVKYNRIGIVDLRAFRAGKSLEESLFFASSGGQAWDVMFDLRPRETLHLNWRTTGNTFNTRTGYGYLIRKNELAYVPLDIEVEEIAGFDYGAMKSLWSSAVSDDEKRGILKCMRFHFKQ